MFNIVSGGGEIRSLGGDVPFVSAPKSNFPNVKVKRLQRTVARLLECLQSQFGAEVSERKTRFLFVPASLINKRLIKYEMFF